MASSSSSSSSYETASFTPELVHELLKPGLGDKTKIATNTLKLTAEVLRTFVVEAGHRAAVQAKMEGDTVVEPQHVEKTVAQLLLDF
eukprot:m.97769 g.97769  ORF g.97769 m.97769 type:complete len:87 (-) comp15059_c0_seq1:9-269(-)